MAEKRFDNVESPGLKDIGPRNHYRQSAAKNAKETVTVKTLLDIKKAIVPYTVDQGTKSTMISAEVEHQDEKGKTKKEVISARVSEPSPRAMLMEGLELVRKRMEYANRAKEMEEDGINILVVDSEAAYSWVDGLIHKRLDGKRHGLKVRWHVQEGDYEWDPFTGDLTKLD